MSFTISKRVVDGITILDLRGRVTLGDATGKVREAVKSALVEQPNVILNLEDVGYMDSAGLGEMVGAFTSARGRGGNLKLLNAQKRLNDLLQLTRLCTVFETFDDERAAIHSYTAGAER
jgi:anti-sigma B factor antagonist